MFIIGFVLYRGVFVCVGGWCRIVGGLGEVVWGI